MRLQQRGRARVVCRGREIRAAVRPMQGMLNRFLYGEYVQDMVRLLLPYDAAVAPGDPVTLADAPYVCVAVRSFPGHLQADIRRCAR